MLLDNFHKKEIKQLKENKNLDYFGSQILSVIDDENVPNKVRRLKS